MSYVPKIPGLDAKGAALSGSTLGAAGAVIWSGAQTLTSAQAGQAVSNLSPAGGAAGTLKFADSYGITFYSTDLTTIIGVIYSDTTNSKLHIDCRKHLSLTVTDGSINGQIIQLGSANGTAGTDFTYIPRQGTASGGATTKNSQYFIIGAEYWDGAARVSTGVSMRTLALDTSGNVALEVAAESIGGDVTTAAQLRVPAGTKSFVGLSVGVVASGLYAPFANYVSINSGAGNDTMQFGGGTIRIAPDGGDTRFQFAYRDSESDPSWCVYYTQCGAGVVDNTNWYLTANAKKALQLTSTGLNVFVAGQSTVAKIGGTLYSTITATGNVGTGEDDLDSYTVPASTLQNNGDQIFAEASFTFAAAALNSVRLRGYYGGALFYDSTALVLPSGNAVLWAKVERTGASTQLISFGVQTNSATFLAVAGAQAGVTTGAVANASSQILKFTATLTDGGGGTGNNQLVQNEMTVLFYPTP